MYFVLFSKAHMVSALHTHTHTRKLCFALTCANCDSALCWQLERRNYFPALHQCTEAADVNQKL